ncbi:MAG TPA: putative DNA binding domain-containing protein [Candidatus Absconditabacterales bacterium]|nr:putative DNA binding domain-containing protein [Candidatus Absconditabacterales bacterium]
MSGEDIKHLLEHPESEVLECKHAERDFHFDDIGKYFSALSNEANLLGKSSAWLIFGVQDKTHKILGTAYRSSGRTLQSLKKEIADKMPNRITFVNIIQEKIDNKRVIAFEIPAAPCGLPIARNGYFYARDDESLVALNLEKIERIRSQYSLNDRSAKACEGAIIDDIDQQAFLLAKNGYIQKHYVTDKQMADNVAGYDIMRFLEEASMLTQDKKITNTAIVLLGKKSARQKLPYSWMSFEIFWREVVHGVDQEFTIPFQLSIPEIVDKIAIKNIEIANKLMGVYTGNNTLLPNYNKENLRECVANCIAHQDYSQQKRITINETIHQHIIFENAGACLYNADEFNQIRIKKKTPDRYRNPFLVNAMREIGLMESKGSGHFKMFEYCKKVYLPLPEVDRSNQDSFVMTIYGASLDEKFVKILQTKTDLDPITILLLDQVQKGHKIDTKMFAILKKQGYLEGTPTKGKLSFEFMKKIGKEHEYIDALDDNNLKILIYEKVKTNKQCTRFDIDQYIMPKMQNTERSIERKKKYIDGLITQLRKKDYIKNTSKSKKYPIRKIDKNMPII